VTAHEGMYCSTCGALVPPGRAACDTCGERVGIAARLMQRGPDSGASGYPAFRQAALGTCPHCGYRGDGMPYFSRGKHVAGIVVAAMFTSFAMGAGGFAYYLLRREHRVCPRCGSNWGPRGQYALVQRDSGEGSGSMPAPLMHMRESSKGTWGIILMLMGLLMAIGAIVGGEIPPLLFATALGAGGYLLHRAAETDREARRAAMISSLQLPVLQLAAERKGRLTVTEVAAELGWTLPRAEKVLNSLDDGYRVNSEVTDEGLIVYEFRELLRIPGGSDPRHEEPWPEDGPAA
jgi:hypothetical protein